MTNEILQGSVAISPITDIAVDDCEPEPGDFCDVHARYRMANEAIATTIRAERSPADHSWKIKRISRFATLDFGNSSIHSYRINGSPFRTAQFLNIEFELLPGVYQITSDNPFVTVSNATITIPSPSSSPGGTTTRPITDVSKAGESMAATSVREKIRSCMEQWRQSSGGGRITDRTCGFAVAVTGGGKPVSYDIRTHEAPAGKLFVIDDESRATITNMSAETASGAGWQQDKCVPIQLTTTSSSGTAHVCFFWVDVSDPENVTVRVM